jgi:DNA replication protein DnaC
MHDEGKRVFFLKATNLTKFAFEQFSEDKLAKQNAMQSLSNAMSCKVLLLDDVGKGRLSPSAEEQLYTILDFRSENGLPTIWTTNASASTLHDMMSEDRGDAIIRRLVEFSEIITTK